MGASLRCLSIALAFSCAVAWSGLAAGDDWPQWRGPSRSGAADGGPKLVSTWPKEGPKKLWQYQAPSGEAGNLSSVAVAGGRAFVNITWKYQEPVATRKLGEGELRRLGWFPKKPPEELLSAVEEARLSAERAALVPKEVGPWVKKWIDAKLNEQQKKEFGGFVEDRLTRGPSAAPLDSLDKLGTIKDKEFEGQDALDKWLAEAGLADDIKAAVSQATIKTRKLANDVFVCLDAETGAELWKKQYPGQAQDNGSSGTPCISSGRCHIVGSGGQAYCLSATDGEEIWKAPVTAGANHASFLVAEGLAIVPADVLTAFDAETGRVVWTQPKVKTRENSPVLWRSGDTSCLVCNTNSDVACAELKTGNLLWKAPGGLYSTAVVEGDYLVILSGEEKVALSAYRMSTSGAEKLWTVPLKDRGASPVIHNGCVYVLASGQAACVKLTSGAVAWSQKVGGGEISSPIAADGKIIAVVDTSALVMFEASPEKFTELGRAKLGITTCTSPALAGGKLYLRLEKAVACFDLADAGADPTR